MPRNALLVEIMPEDEATAVEANKWNCVIVRAIQRKLPEALRVQADAEHITFTLPDDGPTGTRYVCDTPADVRDAVIKNFDLRQPIPEDAKTFSLVAREAYPVVKRSRRRNIQKNAWQRKRRAIQDTKSRNPNVHTYNRFLSVPMMDDEGDDK